MLPKWKKQDKMRRLIRKAFFVHLKVLRKKIILTCPEVDFDKYSAEEFDPPTGHSTALIDDKEGQMPFEYSHGAVVKGVEHISTHLLVNIRVVRVQVPLVLSVRI